MCFFLDTSDFPFIIGLTAGDFKKLLVCPDSRKLLLPGFAFIKLLLVLASLGYTDSLSSLARFPVLLKTYWTAGGGVFVVCFEFNFEFVFDVGPEDSLIFGMIRLLRLI